MTSENVVFRDPLITSRVKQYLYENQELYIDITEMADHLQRRYRDYKGKKRGPFRTMVRRAYDEITENLTRQADVHWPDSDDVDIEIDAIPPEYSQSHKRSSLSQQNGNSSDKELIDISSDDDQVKDNTTTETSKSTHESVQVEPVHVAKRPHLSPSVDKERNLPVPQESRVDVQARPFRLEIHQERSKKRPREKNGEVNFESLIAAKKKLRDVPTVDPTVKFADVGGNSKVLETVANLLIHLKHPEVYSKLGIAPPRGFLLHGPPGCGKTLLAHAIAGELKIPLLKVAAPELVAGISGDSEQRIRELFEQAAAAAPCILFLDEIDAVAPHRANTQREMEKRIVSQLLYCLDELSMKEKGNEVLVIGATNRPDSIDPALRRAGRFDREVSLGIPDKEARTAILKVHTAKVTISPKVSLEKIAVLTPGFVGADLVALIREASMAAVNRVFDDLKKNAKTPNPPATAVDMQTTEEKDKTKDVEKVSAMIGENLTDKTETETMKDVAESESVKNLEEESKADDKSVAEQALESSESALDQPKVAEADAAVPTEPTSEQKTDSDLNTIAEPVPTDVLIESPSNGNSSAVAEQEEEEKKVSRLEEILSWLHSEPPLTEEQLALLSVEVEDFEMALKSVQPSAKREGFATVPDVTWDDIGSLQDIRQELQMTIMAPIRHADHFANLGLTTPTGVLLCGPPGCGKTLLAKAIANEAGINFISVKGPELLNMYVGESERAVRQCFMRARNSSPCVIFFDELDALCPKRSEDENKATSRVVNQMLTEMDGVEGRKDVFLMAASNRPDIIDRAVLRPGRLDKILYVGLPGCKGRVDILRALTKNGSKPKLGLDVDLEAIANDERCSSYTGADLAALIREAGVEALREIMNGAAGSWSGEICARHFEEAFYKIKPSVDEKDMKTYERLQRLYSVKRSQPSEVPMTVELPTETNSMEAMET